MISSSLTCSTCYNVFKNQQTLKNHLEIAACRRKTIKDLEKENAELEAAMAVGSEENLDISPVTQDKVTAENIKQLSAAMLDQLKRFDQDEVEEAVPFVELAALLSSPLRTTRREQGVFKAPLPVARRRGRAVEGMLTSRSCSYCDLELPDFTSLALHYVRAHWEEVRRRQRGQGPRSKFHVSDSLEIQEQPQAPRPSSYKRGPQGPFTPSRATQGPTTYTKSLQGPTTYSRAPLGQTIKGLQGPSATPSWMKKLGGSTNPSYMTDSGVLRQPKPQPQREEFSKCNVCGAAFSTFVALYRHKNENHGRREWKPAGAARPILPRPSSMGPTLPRPRPPPSPSHLPACEVCDNEFSWPDPGHTCARTTASKAGPGSEVEVKRKQTDFAPIIKMVENSTVLGCSLCKDTFINRSMFNKHQKEKHGNSEHLMYRFQEG